MMLEFGYYPYKQELRAANFSIAPLPNIDESITRVAGSDRVHDGWFYAPRQPTRDFMTGEAGTRPYSARIFGLPNTHQIDYQTCSDPARLRFLMHCLGFFEGMRLDASRAGFQDAAPIMRGKLNDFWLSGEHLSNAMTLADRFWDRHVGRPDTRMSLLGVFQSLALAHAPQALPFEQFIYGYIAIEGCFAIGKITNRVRSNGTHADRTAKLCDALKIPYPKWITEHGSVNVFKVRNATLHDGLFLGQPFGFASFHDIPVPDNERHATTAIPRAMRNLVCRFVVALLGLRPMSYLRSETSERSPCWLEV